MSNEDTTAIENIMNDEDTTAIKNMLWRFLIQHGLWAMLTVFLILTILGWFPSPLSRDVQFLQTVILENRRVIVDTNRQVVIDHGYQNILLRAICRNMLTLQQQGQCEPKYFGFDETVKK